MKKVIAIVWAKQIADAGSLRASLDAKLSDIATFQINTDSPDAGSYASASLQLLDRADGILSIVSSEDYVVGGNFDIEHNYIVRKINGRARAASSYRVVKISKRSIPPLMELYSPFEIMDPKNVTDDEQAPIRIWIDNLLHHSPPLIQPTEIVPIPQFDDRKLVEHPPSRVAWLRWLISAVAPDQEFSASGSDDELARSVLISDLRRLKEVHSFHDRLLGVYREVLSVKIKETLGGAAIDEARQLRSVLRHAIDGAGFGENAGARFDDKREAFIESGLIPALEAFGKRIPSGETQAREGLAYTLALCRNALRRSEPIPKINSPVYAIAQAAQFARRDDLYFSGTPLRSAFALRTLAEIKSFFYSCVVTGAIVGVCSAVDSENETNEKALNELSNTFYLLRERERPKKPLETLVNSSNSLILSFIDAFDSEK